MLRVTVRTAASAGVGAGHVARTLAVATELDRVGSDVRWACDADTVSCLRDRGVRADRIRVMEASATAGQAGERQATDADQQRDAMETLALGHPDADWVLVDTYRLGLTWQRAVRAVGARIAAFDDLMDRPLEVDLVVNAAGMRTEYESIAPQATALCGLDFAVTSTAPAPPPHFSAPRGFLVAFGASDSTNATFHVLRELAKARRDNDPFVAWVQLGHNAPHREGVERLARELGWARMLMPSDTVDAGGRGIAVAIGASGVSLFERMRDGIPGIVMPIAPNQRRIADAAERCGAVIRATDPASAVSAAIDLRLDVERLRELSSAGQLAVDGVGARRIANRMFS
jgi:spore coat polysaccharide biosynthesis predicted glycosyltransferase SpsG